MNKRQSARETAVSVIEAIRANPVGVAEIIQEGTPDISEEEARRLALSFIGLFEDDITEIERHKRQQEYCRKMSRERLSPPHPPYRDKEKRIRQ